MRTATLARATRREQEQPFRGTFLPHKRTMTRSRRPAKPSAKPSSSSLSRILTKLGWRSRRAAIGVECNVCCCQKHHLLKVNAAAASAPTRVAPPVEIPHEYQIPDGTPARVVVCGKKIAFTRQMHKHKQTLVKRKCLACLHENEVVSGVAKSAPSAISFVHSTFRMA